MLAKIIKFSAEWCGPCKVVKKNMETIEFPIEEVDVDENSDMCVKYNVRNVPTLVYLDEDGTELYRSVGVVTKDTILNKIKELSK